MTSIFDSYFNEGHTSYKADRCREAALLFARAREAALQSGDQKSAFQAGFWKAEALYRLGKNRQAYELLFLILSEAPESVPLYERWLAEKKVYQVWLTLVHRSKTECIQRLDRLRAFAMEHPNVPAGDLPELWAHLAWAAGDWTEVLHLSEEAWTVSDGLGSVKLGKAVLALKAALRLGHREEAEQWLSLIGQTEQDWGSGRVEFHCAQALLILHKRGDRSALEDACQALGDDLISASAKTELRQLVARLWLLLRPNDDPKNAFHPARAALRVRPEREEAWENQLALADFRLASVRFMAGVPPCDDYYYRDPQQLPARIIPSDPAEFARRVSRTRVAIARVQRTAELLDRLNECSWYSAEARARFERLEEIYEAACESVDNEEEVGENHKARTPRKRQIP